MTGDDMKMLYKLMVLYMLDKVDFSLTRAQIFDFMLSKEYTDYIKLQGILYELIEADLIESVSKKNSSNFTITDQGQTTIDMFRNHIPDDIKDDIDQYFLDKELQMRNRLAVQSNYYRNSAGEYTAELVANEKNSELINIRISMPTEDSAASVCDNWMTKNQEVYSYIIKELL